VRVGAVVIAVVLGLLGVRSFVRLSGVSFDARSTGEQFLYALHVTARTCVWFALAGAFVGYALLDEPERFRWYVFIPLSLAAIQLLAAVALSRTPGDRTGEPGDGDSRPGR
jgi:NADH:ubiquinone oxidoreductase subunit H